MTRLIVQTCAILACIAVSALCSHARTIDCVSTKQCPAHAGQAHDAIFALTMPEPPSPHAQNILLGGNGHSSFDDRLLESLAAGLFGTDPLEGAGTYFYCDSTTLCMAVSSIRHNCVYPQGEGTTRLSLGGLLSGGPECEDMASKPGVMFLAGISLMGLSMFRKRVGAALESFGQNRVVDKAAVSPRS